MLRSVFALVLIWNIPALASDAHQATSKAVDPDTALHWLMNGNSRFIKAAVRSDGQSKKDVDRLSSSQHPHAIVLSCSDSRVPPEVVFDQKLGEIFVVRTAGEALDDNVIGSIEYAVEHLGSKLLVVMGHTSCGAVKAALDTRDGKSAGSPALDHLVKEIHPHLKDFKDKPSAGYEKEVWAHTDGVAKDLISRSSLLKKHFEHGEIWIVPSLYHLDSGVVEFHGHLIAPAKIREYAGGE